MTDQPPMDNTPEASGPPSPTPPPPPSPTPQKTGHRLIADYVRRLDGSPGVYRMLDAEARVLAALA